MNMGSSEGFECKACGIKFASANALAEHEKMHADMKANDDTAHEHFACNACGATFQSEAELKEHGQKYHM